MSHEASQPDAARSTGWLGRRFDEHPTAARAAQFGLVIAATLFVSWLLWGGSDPNAQADTAIATAADQAAGPTLWTCSMHPQIRQPTPGQCPICGMDLIPVAQTSGGMRTLALSPESVALINIEVMPVERRYVERKVPMVGRVDYDETRLGYITAWVSGRLDRLFVDYTGVEVKKGDHLASIYSEQLYAAQQELIEALKTVRVRTSSRPSIQIDLVESSREKLRLLGLTEEQIETFEKSDNPSDQLTIYAPMGGIVIEKLKQQGERIKLGERIYTIADLSQVWVHLDAYESDLPWIRYGQDVTVTTEAYPGERFHGRIAFIQPVLNDKTRTVRVRVNVPNQDRKLKPGMFVRAVVRPKVAAGGKVMDSNLAGKWISPMHPEIIKDEPGTCDICGMPLVRVESLGYVTAIADDAEPPLVVPYSSALVTGSRAIVYVQLPNMPSFAGPAFQTLSTVVQNGKLDKIRAAFTTYADMLDRPYDQPGTDYARRTWNDSADRLASDALAGQQSKSAKQAEQILARIEITMDEARERFAPADRPTFEGREIVLGPRAGDYYLVRHGVEEGELVVTHGNFKLDAEIQLQAKPSMMTPEGGGGGKKAGDGEHAGDGMVLPAEFYDQIQELDAAYDQVAEAIQQQDLDQATGAFKQFERSLNEVDVSLLTGDPRIQWKEFAMLLGNDAVEGGDTTQLAEADRVFLLVKSHMRRMRERLGLVPDQEIVVEAIAVSPEFQGDLGQAWKQYQGMERALAADDLGKARNFLAPFKAAIADVDVKTLTDRANKAWTKERGNLEKLFDGLEKSKDITAMRESFYPVSQEIGVLAKTFGFGETGPVYELHCPMAFGGRGAVWYQDNDKTLNPYFGSKMLKCADRVEEIAQREPDASKQHDPHQNHSHP